MPILGIVASSTRQGLVTDTGAMFPLGMVNVGSAGAADITFSSIPSTYTHLQVRMMAIPSVDNASGLLQFNSDTGSNYAWHQLGGAGSTPFASGDVSQTSIRTLVSTPSGGPSPAIAVIDILDYKNTNKYKTVRTLTGSDSNSAGYIILRSGVWMNTNAVTSLKLAMISGTWNQYTSAALYGIL